jgi:DNA-binding XRE family transcriptional regulator
MEVQIIRTESGEELVVLSRRAYDALRARLGDEEAEDRMTLRLAAEFERDLAAGTEFVLPGWFANAAASGNGSVIRGLRQYRGKSQQDVATAAGITQGYFSDVERGAKVPTVAVLDAISDALDCDRRWLRALERGRVTGA